MNFLKNFLNDNSIIIGLCGFETIKRKYNGDFAQNIIFLNPFKHEKVFETDFSKNPLLF